MNINIVTFLSTVLISAMAVGIYLKGKDLINIEKKKQEAEEMIEKSRLEAEKLLGEAKEQIEKYDRNNKEEVEKRESRIKKTEESLEHKDGMISKKEERLNETKKKKEDYKDEIVEIRGKIDEKKQEVVNKLEQKSGKNVEEFRLEILKNYKNELDQDIIKKLNTVEEDLKENAFKIAKNLVIGSLQRLCSPTSVETRAINVTIEKDFVKGKIVGKDGRNIKALEILFPDVAIVFNDLPQTISLSAFSLVNRRTAQRTIEILVALKEEITEGAIKKAAKDAEKEIAEELYTLGKNGIIKAGLDIKRFERDFVIIIGRLQYRTSYGQNIMRHSIEVSSVAAMLGCEIGLDVDVCKVAGFLHDVGKAIDQDPTVQDAHDRITKELMEKYGFTEDETHAAWVHHDAEPQKTPEALIIKAADAVSAGRPGARQESIYTYAERIQALEEVVSDFKGIKKHFAMSAGREVRAYVKPSEVSDKDMITMAEAIARKIEEEVVYPGKIKVNIIRRIEHVEIANK